MDNINKKVTYPHFAQELRTKDSAYWMKVREREMLELFKKVSSSVPAYKKFLRENSVNPKTIKSWNDFQKVPLVTKDNYLRKYPYNELYWGGSINGPIVYTATSGSTGNSFYLGRKNDLDYKHSIITESIVRQRYAKNNIPILFIDAFGMGVWIGGLINYKAADLLANRENLPLSIVTPGVNKKEILNIFKYIAPNYKQVLLAGYPPFIKDVLDEIVINKIDIGKFDLRLVFAAENITEPFREYVAGKAHVKSKYIDIVNIYGSAELGAMAQESLVCTLIREMVHGSKRVANNIFSQSFKSSTIAQFIPYFTNFEQVGNKVVVTGDSAIPLVRYDIGDNGGVISYDDLEAKLDKLGINLKNKIVEKKLEKYNYKLPFVYVYERFDFAVKLKLHDVYPQIIKEALMSSELCNYLTGKFTMVTRYNKDKDQYLELNIEMKKNISKKEIPEKKVEDLVLESLKNKAEGPGDICELVKKPGLIETIFWPYEHLEFFAPGTKQKWVEKE